MIAPPDALVFSASKMSDEIRNPLLLSPKVPPSAAPVYVRMHFARDTNSCNDHPVMPPPAIARAAPDALARAQPTPRTKGLLKTPNSTSKRKSVIFVDNRNETAYLASASNDPDFIPGIIRMPTPGRPTPARAATGTTPAPTASAAKSSSKKRTTGEAERSPQGTASKRRKIGDPGPPPTTTVVMAASGAQIVTLAGAAPACEDIEDYFLHAANALFADILAGTARTPERYYGKGSASKGSAGKADKSPAKAEWADSAARTLFGTDKPSPAQTAAVERRFTEATGFLFQAPPGAAPTAEQVSVVTACFHNASAAVAGAPASSPGKTSPAVSQMFGDAMELDRFRAMQAAATGVALPPSAEKAGRRRSSAGKPGTPKAATPKGKSPARGKSPAKGLSKEDEAAAAEAWAAEVDASKTPARDFKAAAKGLKPGRNSRRSSSGAEWANEQFAEVAPKSEKKVTGRRSLSAPPASRTPAKGLSKEDEAAAAEAWAAEVAASKTPARDFKAAAKGLKPGRNSRRSSSGAEWANEQFAEVAPKSEKKVAGRRSLSQEPAPVASGKKASRRSSAGAWANQAFTEMEVEEEEVTRGRSATPKATTPKGKSPARGKSPAKGLSKEDEAAAAEAWAAEVDASKTPARDFKAAAKGLKPGRNSRRSSSGAEWANEQFAEVAPKSEKKVTGRRSLSQEPAPVASGKKASRRSSAGAWANQAFTEMEVEEEEVTRGRSATPKATTPKGKSPAKGLSKEDEAAAAEAWAAEVAASKTPARDFKAAAKGLKPGRNSRRSSSGAEWANEQFAEVAPKSEKKVAGRRSLSQEPAPVASGKKASRRSSAGAWANQAFAEEEEDLMLAAEIEAGLDLEKTPAPVASGKKASRRSSAGAWANQAFTEMEVEDEEVTRGRSATPKATTPKGKSPAKGLSKEDEAAAAEAWAAEVAASKTPARDFKAAAKGLKPGRNSRRSSSGAEWANEQFAEVLVAPKSAEKLPASRRSLSPAAEPKAVPARRNRKSVLPALDSAGPLLAEATPEETAAVPPPRRGRKSVIPALPESEDAAPARRTRKSVAPAALPAPVEEAVEEAPARASKRKSVGAAPAGKRARSSLAAASPHVSIGKSVEYAITPRQKGDWRAAGLVDEEEEEEEVVAAPAPAKKAARGKKAAAAAPVEEEAAPAPAKKAARGKKAAAAAPVEEEAAPAPAKKATRGKKAAAAAPVEEEAAPAPAKKAARGKKAAAAAPVEEEAAPAPAKKATRGKKAAAAAPVEEEAAPAPAKKAARGKKAAAAAPVEEEAAPAPAKKATRGKKAAAPVEEEASPAKKATAKKAAAKKAAPAAEPAPKPTRGKRAAAAAPAEEEPAPKRATRRR